MDALAKLGIDGWGLLLYLVNFGVLLILLKRFVYKPLIKYLEERQKRIKEDVERAEEIRKQLVKERADEVDERKARLLALDERIKEAKTVAREEAKRVIQEADQQREAILTNASEVADATISSTIKETEKEILERVRRVVTHVLEEGVPKELVEESVQKSWKRVTKRS